MQTITLKINYQRKAEKFLGRNQAKITADEVKSLIVKAVRRLTGKNENIDFRIRKNNLRIIFNIYEDDKEIVVTVVDIDFRGSIYK